jgi:aryl-alcohol dehydrogenase-like predicted oxidoreductase
MFYGYERKVHVSSGEYVRLGTTGLKVSRLCLGTMTFGTQADEKESFAILNKAFDAGVNFIDTADVYPLGGGHELAGTTESIIGKWLPRHRDEVVIATKCVGEMGRLPHQRGASRRHIFDAVDASLKRLNTDYIDLYQLHSYDPETKIEESLSALDDLVRMGKVRYVGCSNFKAWQLARALGKSETHSLVRFDSVQPRYNLLFREIERELLPLCLEEGVGVIPYNPIAGGLLSGKHLGSTEPEPGTRFNSSKASQLYRDRYWHKDMFEMVNDVIEVAKRAGVPVVTLAVAWVAAHAAVTSPIIGASKAFQLDDSLKALDYVIDPQLKKELDEMTSQYRRGDSER